MRWIKASERLPENSQYVHCQTNYNRRVVTWVESNKKWDEYQFIYDDEVVVKWLDETESTPTPERTAEEIGFGDYVTIEMKRYGCPNEFYIYKVIGRLKSNSWTDVPAITHVGDVLHTTMEDVLNCVCEGVGEDRFERFRVCDVKLKPHRLQGK